MLYIKIFFLGAVYQSLILASSGYLKINLVGQFQNRLANLQVEKGKLKTGLEIRVLQNRNLEVKVLSSESSDCRLLNIVPDDAHSIITVIANIPENDGSSCTIKIKLNNGNQVHIGVINSSLYE